MLQLKSQKPADHFPTFFHCRPHSEEIHLPVQVSGLGTWFTIIWRPVVWLFLTLFCFALQY